MRKYNIILNEDQRVILVTALSTLGAVIDLDEDDLEMQNMLSAIRDCEDLDTIHDFTL